MCVWSLRYPAFNVLAPFCHLWPVRLYNIFPNYFTNGTIFEKQNVFEHRKCILIFSKTLVSNTFHSRQNWAKYDQNVHWSSCKVPIILVRFKWNLNFLYRFSKNTQVPNFRKIDPMGAELFRADRRMDRRADRHDGANRRFLLC